MRYFDCTNKKNKLVILLSINLFLNDTQQHINFKDIYDILLCNLKDKSLY